MDPGVTSVAIFFALVLFAAAAVLPFLGNAGDWGSSVALGVGFALLGALFVWLAVVAQ
jgi:hypothetical protein